MLGKTGVWLTATLAFVLAACGGSSAPPIAVTAAPDTASLDWNTTSTVDVLANDSASKGTLTLNAVSAPAHGKASIAGTAIQYTPDAGYFGTDSLTYTVQAEDGTTGTGTLDLTVTAKLTVSGTASDGPLPDAAVMATVGMQTFKATADASGKYSIAIATSTPTDVITVTAVGAGTQSQVKLRSVLGDALAVSKLAAAGGLLGADQLASTNVNQVSTALAALIEEANGGKTPATLAQLSALTTAASLERLEDNAIAIQLVADEDVPLPSGVTDTMALVDHPSTSTVLANFLYAQETVGDAYIVGSQSLFSTGSVPGGASSVAGVEGHSLVYGGAYKKSAPFSFQVNYAGDGTAQVLLPGGPQPATWSQANGIVTLNLSKPYADFTIPFSAPNSPVQDTALGQTTGFQFVQLNGTASGGIVMVQFLGSYVVQSGVDKGQVIPYSPSNFGPSIDAVIDLAAVPALSDSDFPVGTLWGGLLVGKDTVNVATQEDVMSITGPGTATFVRSGAATWSIADGVLKVVNGGFEYDYQRMIAAAPTGEEEWFVTVVNGGAVTDMGIQMVAKVSSGLKFTDAASLTERWQSGFALNEFYDLNTGGTGTEIVGPPDVPTISTPLTWALNKDGTVTIVKNNNGSTSQREWTLLGRQAGSIFVMEHLDTSDAWQMNIYADLGIAPVSSIPAPAVIARTPSGR